MPYMEKRIISGRYMEIVRYSISDKGKKPPRGAKEKLSSEAQMNLNYKNACKTLTRLINTNFTEKDLFITLTYKNKNQITESQAKKALENYIRRVKAHRKKNGLPDLKYITVTEIDKKNGIHHHVLFNNMSLDDIEKIWGLGRIKTSRLEPDENGYAALANYFLKQKGKDRGKSKNTKRWNQSKNLAQPEIPPPRVLKRINLYKPPKVKGYRVTSVEQSFNDFAGFYQYVQLVKLE